MIELETIEIINISGSIIFSFFTFLIKKFQSRNFREDFKEFRKDLETHFHQDIKPKLLELTKNNKLTLEEFSKTFSKQLSKINTIREMTGEYMQIRNKIKFIPISFLVSFVLTILKINSPAFNFWGYNPTKIAFLILVVGIGLIIHIIWGLDNLDKNITRVSLGEPIDKILKEILEEKERNEN